MMYLSQAKNQSSMPDQCHRGCSGVGYSLGALDAGVYRWFSRGWVVFPIVESYDDESTVGPIGAVFEHERVCW